ncbi:MAG: META domain-containing protein [Povalibacter sp.]
MKASTRSRVRAIAFALFCFAVAACHRSPPPQSLALDSTQAGPPPKQTPVPAKAQPLPQELPAFYTGMLPCADCEGIRYELQLRADQVFFTRMTYLGKPAPNTVDQIGRWTLGEDRVLTLNHGQGSPELWSMTDVTALHKLDLHGQKIASSQNLTLTRQSEYETLEPSLEMRGQYRRAAAGAVFRECLTGLELPLAPESNRAALDSAYAKAQDSGAVVLATVQGRILRNRTDENAVTDVLMIDEFKSLAPNETCGATGVTHELEGTRWALVRLNEDPIQLKADQREPFFVLEPSEHRISGDGGCNRMVGRYEQTGQTLHFTELAMTRMACPNMQMEESLQQALTSAANWSIEGSQLKLLDVSGNIVARFEARNLL